MGTAGRETGILTSLSNLPRSSELQAERTPGESFLKWIYCVYFRNSLSLISPHVFPWCQVGLFLQLKQHMCRKAYWSKVKVWKTKQPVMTWSWKTAQGNIFLSNTSVLLPTRFWCIQRVRGTWFGKVCQRTIISQGCRYVPWFSGLSEGDVYSAAMVYDRWDVKCTNLSWPRVKNLVLVRNSLPSFTPLCR